MKKSLLKDNKDLKNEERSMFSISSVESELKICWILSQKLEIQLTLENDLIVTKKNIDSAFRNYYYENEEGFEKVHLYVNRNKGTYLFPELKKVDYILLIRSESAVGSLTEMVPDLRNIPGIDAILQVDIAKLKSFSRLKLD